MKLLIFAHRNEARTFLKRDRYKAYPFIFEGVYQNKEHYLLICGEGIGSAMMKTASLMGHLKHILTSIVNIGVAGSLTPSIAKDQICKILTSYHYSGNEMSFQSYTGSNGVIDCISIDKRSLSLKEKEYLESFAPLVERELWGIASVAKLFSIPFSSFKIIVDHFEDVNICKTTREKASYFSGKLYDYYREKFLEKNHSIQKHSMEIPKIFAEQLYFTTSMKQKFNSYTKRLDHKTFATIPFKNILLDSINSKDAALKLNDHLHSLLNPVQKKINFLLERAAYPLKSGGFSVNFDKQYETNAIELKIIISSEEDLRRASSSLLKFDIKKIDQILDGEIDV